MNVEESENVHGGYGKTVSHVIIGLKTTKGTKMLKLDPSIYENIQKERVTIGDVIYIEVNSGAIKVCGVHFYFFLNSFSVCHVTIESWKMRYLFD